MPVCFVCFRKFVNRDALHQHMRSSSAPHPHCKICERRFISETALQEHTERRHPPIFPCELCGRTFHTDFALSDHLRGSPNHPNCFQCGMGFFDAAARLEHYPKCTGPIERAVDESGLVTTRSSGSQASNSPNLSVDKPTTGTSPPQVNLQTKPLIMGLKGQSNFNPVIQRPISGSCPVQPAPTLAIPAGPRPISRLHLLALSQLPETRVHPTVPTTTPSVLVHPCSGSRLSTRWTEIPNQQTRQSVQSISPIPRLQHLMPMGELPGPVSEQARVRAHPCPLSAARSSPVSSFTPSQTSKWLSAQVDKHLGPTLPARPPFIGVASQNRW